MCGRYYVDDDTAEEIGKFVRQSEEKLWRESAAALERILRTDIHPTDAAPVLLAAEGSLCCTWLRWGFPLQQGPEKGLVFNARCESVAEKPLFREGMRRRRAVIPAAGFYEWDREKTKYTFREKDRKVLLMAGCCRQYRDGERFVILTTKANPSMKPVHDRMPLLLDPEEARDWILDGGKTAEILKKTPPLLEMSAEYEQLSFFQ